MAKTLYDWPTVNFLIPQNSSANAGLFLPFAFFGKKFRKNMDDPPKFTNKLKKIKSYLFN